MPKDKGFTDFKQTQDSYTNMKDKETLKNEDLKYEPENPYVGVEKVMKTNIIS